jgi:hypothetical protein
MEVQVALDKRLIKAYAAARSFRVRRKKVVTQEPSTDSVFTPEFTFEFEGRPNT